MHDIPFDVLAAIASLIYAVSLFIDNLTGKQWGSALKQFKTWVVGVLGVMLLAHVQFSSNITIGGIGVHQLSSWSQLLVGLTTASLANTVFHLGQRFDPTGSGDTPTITLRRTVVTKRHRAVQP